MNILLNSISLSALKEKIPFCRNLLDSFYISTFYSSSFTSALKGKTLLPFVDASPKPNVGMIPSSSNGSRVRPRIVMTWKENDSVITMLLTYSHSEFPRSIVCYFHTFENNLEIKQNFTKYLKESCW